MLDDEERNFYYVWIVLRHEQIVYKCSFGFQKIHFVYGPKVEELMINKQLTF